MDKAQVQKSPSTTIGKQNSQRNRTRASKHNRQIQQFTDSGSFQTYNASNNLTPSQLVHLQRTLGNQAVSQIIQAKLTISQPDDPYEREADQVADQVMRMPEPEMPGEEETKVQTKPLAGQITPLIHRVPENMADEGDETIQTKAQPEHSMQALRVPSISFGSVTGSIQRLCTECAEEEPQDQGKPEMAQRKQARYQLHDDNDEEEQRVQPKGAHTPTPQVTPTVAANIHALNHGGSPLPKATRAFFEPRFGVDLSQVRVHTGPQASETAKAINARAFTVGNNIAFGEGQFAPGSHEGRRLLAHELTHTIQQGPASISHSASAPHYPAADLSITAPNQRSTSSVVQPNIIGSDTISSTIQQKNASGEQALVSRRDDSAEREADALVQHGEAVAVVQGQAVPAIQRDTPCPAAPEDYRGVVGSAKALKGEMAELEAPKWGPAADLPLLKRIWMTYGHEATGIYIRQLLRLLRVHHSQEWVDEFVDTFVFRINLEYGPRKSPADTDATLARLIRDIVVRDHKNVKKEGEQFLTCYEGQAREAAKGAVDESKERVIGEVNNYFGSYNFVQTMFGTKNSRDFEEDKASRKGLGIAAEGLSRRRKALIGANADYRAAMGRRDREQIDQAQTLASANYEVFRSQVIALFPILEAVSSPELHPWNNQDVEPDDDKGQQLDTLAQLAHGASTDGELLIFEQIRGRLKDIAKVKEELEPGGDVNVWQLPQLIAATSDLTGATGDTFHGKLVADKLKKENEAKPESWTKRLLDILEIALYVLAPFTEGVTLIPALALTTYRAGSRAYEHWKHYQTQKALGGVGFGPTVLAVEEPSLYWLAADIALAFGEVGLSVIPAAKVFRALGPAARAARAAAGEEAILTLESASKRLTVAELGETKATQFAAKVAADARAARAGAGGVAGMTVVEVEAFAQAEAQLTGAILAEVRTAGGQTIKITARGRIFVCSSPCQWLRERYAAQLANKRLKDRMVKLEAKAASAAAQTDKAVAKRLAEKVAAETQALHVDLAYAEYQLAGGKLTLEEFLNAERVRLIAESTAHALPVHLTEARILEALSRLFWRSPELHLLSPGAVERVVRAALAVERVGTASVPKGALRLAVNWQDLARGQLLEELSSVRLRSLLQTQGGAEALGIGHIADDLIFIEGSRITDEAGLKVSDGIVAAWRRGELEILAVAEAKSAGGKRGVGGLAVSSAQLDRMSTMDIMQAVVEAAGGKSGRVLVQDRAMMRRLATLLTPAQYNYLVYMSGGTLSKWTRLILGGNPAALRDLREPLLQAIERLPARDRNAISALLSRSEGQVARDVERLMKEGMGKVTLKLDGKEVTASIPSRPSFLGVAPSDVSMADISAQLTKLTRYQQQTYAFRALEMGSAGMTKGELDAVAAELVKALSDDMIKAAKAAKP
jgi:hypothetical protein